MIHDMGNGDMHVYGLPLYFIYFSKVVLMQYRRMNSVVL